MKPILFSTPMVQAILEGRKTQTRRTIKHRHAYRVHNVMGSTDREIRDMKNQPLVIEDSDTRPLIIDNLIRRNPYGHIGDVLWVRESFAIAGTEVIRGGEGEIIEEQPQYVFRGQKQQHIEQLYKWKPSLFMPKDAARIFLRVTNVRVERLQDIDGETDVYHEGVGEKFRSGAKSMTSVGIDARFYAKNQLQKFRSLWESINGAGSWDANPWVWVIEFERIEKPQ